jgi:adenine-specific DNA-methyltransferase
MEVCSDCVKKLKPTDQLKDIHVYAERVKVLRGAFSVSRERVQDQDEGSVLTSVFTGGSRNVADLNELVRRCLDSVAEKGLTVLVGDANGADKAIQRYFAAKNYPSVVVYCMAGVCRNKIGNWEVRRIRGGGAGRGWQYVATKDLAMAKDASCGLMIWDGRSKGTVNNLLNLLHFGKVCLLYKIGDKDFVTVRNASDLRAVLAKCSQGNYAGLSARLNLEARLAGQEELLPLR